MFSVGCKLEMETLHVKQQCVVYTWGEVTSQSVATITIAILWV